MDKQTDRKSDRQSDKQTDRHRHRPRQTGRQKERERERERDLFCLFVIELVSTVIKSADSFLMPPQHRAPTDKEMQGQTGRQRSKSY